MTPSAATAQQFWPTISRCGTYVIYGAMSGEVTPFPSLGACPTPALADSVRELVPANSGAPALYLSALRRAFGRRARCKHGDTIDAQRSGKVTGRRLVSDEIIEFAERRDRHQAHTSELPVVRDVNHLRCLIDHRALDPGDLPVRIMQAFSSNTRRSYDHFVGAIGFQKRYGISSQNSALCPSRRRESGLHT